VQNVSRTPFWNGYGRIEIPQKWSICVSAGSGQLNEELAFELIVLHYSEKPLINLSQVTACLDAISNKS
jgi:hypothetical protein